MLDQRNHTKKVLVEMNIIDLETQEIERTHLIHYDRQSGRDFMHRTQLWAWMHKKGITTRLTSETNAD